MLYDVDIGASACVLSSRYAYAMLCLLLNTSPASSVPMKVMDIGQCFYISFFQVQSVLDMAYSAVCDESSVDHENHMNYTVSQEKLCKLIFCQNFVKFRLIVEIFGKKIVKRTSFCVVYSFFTSPNLCQRTTMLNADVLNCYITL